MTLDMSSYAVERDDPVAVEYGEEVLHAGWNPALQQQQVGVVDHPSMPHSMVDVDIDAFLKRMYANQR
jgi:hypothetical protein